MGFWKTVVGLARRRFVGPPVVLAAILLALAGWFLVPTRYVSTASMVLTVPATGGTLETLPESKPGLTNPLLQFNDALRTTAGILILATNRPDVAAELGAPEDGPTSVTINDGRTNPDLLGISTNGPFVYVEVESTSPQVVREVMARAQQRVRLELAERQVALEAPISTHIGVLDVMPASVPKPLIQNRLVAASGGAFAAVTIGLGAAYVIIHLRRREVPDSSTTESPAEASAEDPAVEDDTPHRNGAHPELPELPSFPLTVAELESDSPETETGTEDTGPIEVTRDGQPDSTT